MGRESRAASAARVAEFRKSPKYRQWRMANRERLKHKKEEYRRKKGAKPRSEITQEAMARKQQRAMLRLHDAHVRLWNRLARPAKERERQKRKYQTNPTHAIYHRLKRWMHKHLGDALPSRRWSALLGYTPQELREHLERQFLPGMGWHNKGKWHVDHIVPVSSFDIRSVESTEFRTCFGLPNLRPIWAAENQRKGAKKVTLL